MTHNIRVNTLSEINAKEIFYSIQGEGARAGTPTLFIRLAGCNLNCHFCDTDWKHGTKIRLGHLPAALKNVTRQTYGLPRDVKWVTITGGEPCIAPSFDQLVLLLKNEGYHVSVETNGTKFRPSLDFCYVTVSPKMWWEKGAEIDPEFTHVAELKLLVARDTTLWLANGLRDSLPFKANTQFLQPIYDDREAWRNAYEMVREDPTWRLSLQMQKWLNVP